MSSPFNSSSASDASGSGSVDGVAASNNIIEPAAFEPMADASVSKKGALTAAHLIAAVALCIAVLILWFLFTARSVLLAPMYQGELVSGASFNVDGGLNLPFGGRYLMRPGAFSVTTSHPEYLLADSEFQVSDDDRQRVTIELRRRPDFYTISSAPEGVEVLIAGKSFGLTPLEAVAIDPGEHTVEFKHLRYLAHSENIDVLGGGNTIRKSVEMQPAWAELTINSVPEGAQVFSDQRALGVTPLTAEVYQGEREISVQLELFATHTQTVNIVAGEAQSLETIALLPADASIEIVSSPSDAGVLVNGEFRGQTPITVSLSADKSASIELFKQGYRKYTNSVRYSAGETDKILVSLAPALGEISLSVTPKDAHVTVNGRVLGNTTGTVRLPAVPQKFVVSREGYLPYEKTITPRPGFKQALNARLLTPAATKAAGIKTVFSNPAGQTMRLIKPGQITLGASRREAGRRANENLRRVELKRPFYISATEVTNGQYRQFDFKHTSSRVEDKSLNADGQPVVRVSWVDAAQFCNWLSERESLPKVYTFEGDTLLRVDQQAAGYRLPTEAEWAWSARALAGQTLKFPWGQDWPPPPKAGNFADNKAAYVLGRTLPFYEDGFVASAPVGKFTANQHDLFDMGGNVAEWVHDYYAPGQTAGSQVDPFGPGESNYHVVRGSSWRHGSVVELRLSYRDYADRPRDDLGFRVARYVQ